MTKRPPSFIDPERLYSLRGFQEASGFSASRMRELRLQGLRPSTLAVGRRKFIRGVDAVAYIEAAAVLSASPGATATIE